jgi:hypothetical protein
MSSSGHKPGGKPGQRNKKAEQQRAKKPEQPRSPMPELQPDARAHIEEAQVETAQIETAVASTEAPPPVAVTPAEPSPVGLHTIATAYSDYTRKSLEDTRCFVEKLSRVRSFDKALEVQAEFAKQAYVTFLAESQKMRELYGKLARQTFKPLEGFVNKSTMAPR